MSLLLVSIPVGFVERDAMVINIASQRSVFKRISSLTAYHVYGIMSIERTKNMWYKRNTGIILMLILFFPVGLYLMWRYATWHMVAKILISVGFIVAIIISQASRGTVPPNSATIVVQPPTPTIVSMTNIDVTSLVVKHVDGKYRYFFTISNRDNKPLDGSIRIKLYSGKAPIGEETFNTIKAFDVGEVVYFDNKIAPLGMYGIDRFKYVVMINGHDVKSGEGKISDKYEDIDALK